MEVKRFGFGLDANDKWLAGRRAAKQELADGSLPVWPIPEELLRRKLTVPSQGRLYFVRYALKMGWTIEQVAQSTGYDRWFVDQLKQLVEFEDVLCAVDRLEDLPADSLRRAKQFGYSDAQLAFLYMGSISTKNILAVRAHRKRLKVEPVFKLVDTCAAEFEAVTPYFYSTYETPVFNAGIPVVDDEIRISPRPKIIILGGGPNRIGQGIEFDYCCCQAAFACAGYGLRERDDQLES